MATVTLRELAARLSQAVASPGTTVVLPELELDRADALDLLDRLQPRAEVLTSQEAADLLGVSRPHLAKLLDRGEIPSHKVGTHRRVLRADVEGFAAQIRLQRGRALTELMHLQESMGLYDHDSSGST
ncbi:MAG: helix-turn-helix domain-containing protein [Bacteroidota bacterium]